MTRKAKPASKKYPLMVIEWLDHTGDSGWYHVDKIDLEPAKLMTAGWRVKEDDKAIWLASSFHPKEGEVSDQMCILKSCVVNSKVLLK